MVSKVITQIHVKEIREAQRNIVKLAANWFGAIRNGHTSKAVDIRQNINRIKREIREKYDVILEG